MPPLVVHLIFHPASEGARNLALMLHRALNADSALPGLTVPTVLLTEDGSNLPPIEHDLDQAENSVAVVLVDDEMVVEEPIPPERMSWATFVAGIAKQCETGRHRFLPVQLSESAWPLHADLKSTNFIRAVSFVNVAWLERTIVVEVCRFLLGHERGTNVPITIFLSHAKQDIDKPPTLFKDLVAHLQATQPVAAWVDSGQIQAGKDFSAAIENGVRDTAVLALVTSHYSSRPWCRREIVFAKRYNRPLVVVDGLDAIDIRSFPYIGNVPSVAWSNGGAQRAVDLLLKEQLRHLYVRKVLARSQTPGDCVLPSPPELSTVVALPKGSNRSAQASGPSSRDPAATRSREPCSERQENRPFDLRGRCARTRRHVSRSPRCGTARNFAPSPRAWRHVGLWRTSWQRRIYDCTVRSSPRTPGAKYIASCGKNSELRRLALATDAAAACKIPECGDFCQD
jgi:hypothetical protein